MEDAHLISCRDTFVEIAKQAIQIGRKYESKDKKIEAMNKAFEETLNRRLNDFNPKIMVYGIYNAGKSTILNALMGVVKAEMDDVPTTKKIDVYTWKEYTIFDTPGINAPQKDEEISKEHLKNSDVIIFVMDTEGTFSLEKNYRELVDIIHSGKRLLIVLNNKSGYDRRTEKGFREIQKIENRIFADFATLDGSNPEQLASHYKIITVDAKAALLARTNPKLNDEQRKRLLEDSNIAALEDAIIQEYGRTSGFTILKQLEIELLRNLEQLSRILQEIENDELTSNGNNTLQEIYDLQDQLCSKISDQAREYSVVLNDEIYSICITSKSEEEAQERIQRAAEEWLEKVNVYLQEQLTRVAGRVDNLIGDFNVKVSAICDTPNISPSESQSLPVEISEIPASDDSSPLLDPAGALILEKGMAVALPYIAKLPWVGPVIAKVIGPMIPGIGWVIAGVAVIKGLFGESSREREWEKQLESARAKEKEEQRRLEEEARRKQEAKDESNRLCRKLVSDTILEVRKKIIAIFQPAIARIQEVIKAKRFDKSQASDDLRLISAMREKLQIKVSRFCE